MPRCLFLRKLGTARTCPCRRQWVIMRESPRPAVQGVKKSLTGTRSRGRLVFSATYSHLFGLFHSGAPPYDTKLWKWHRVPIYGNGDVCTPLSSPGQYNCVCHSIEPRGPTRCARTLSSTPGAGISTQTDSVPSRARAWSRTTRGSMVIRVLSTNYPGPRRSTTMTWVDRAPRRKRSSAGLEVMTGRLRCVEPAQALEVG